MQTEKDAPNLMQWAGEREPRAWMIENLFYSFPLSRLPGSRYLKKVCDAMPVPIREEHRTHYMTLRTQGLGQEERLAMDEPPDEPTVLAAEHPSAILKHHETAGSDDRLLSASNYVVGDQCIDIVSQPHHDAMSEAVSEYMGQPAWQQGHFFYPPGAFRGWHTNQYSPSGWRMYIVVASEANRSFFRLKHPDTGEIITVWDHGQTVNFFHVVRGKPLYHCVASETDRWSAGFLVPDNWRSIIARHERQAALV